MDVWTLTQLEEIRVLKARYCRLCDTRQWDELFALFTEDAVFGAPDAAPHDQQDEVSRAYRVGYTKGREAIRRTFVDMSDTVAEMVHKAHTPEIDLVSTDEAVGIWQLEDLFVFSGGPLRTMHGYGHYHDTYVRSDGRWRIASSSVTRLHVDTVPADGAGAQDRR